jgi:hypothetical protein
VAQMYGEEISSIIRNDLLLTTPLPYYPYEENVSIVVVMHASLYNTVQSSADSPSRSTMTLVTGTAW